MQSMTAAEAKQKFGQLMDKAQRGPVAITKHGRRVGILYSADDYESHEREKKQWLDFRLDKASAQIKEGDFVSLEDSKAQIMKTFED